MTPTGLITLMVYDRLGLREVVQWPKYPDLRNVTKETIWKRENHGTAKPNFRH